MSSILPGRRHRLHEYKLSFELEREPCPANGSKMVRLSLRQKFCGSCQRGFKLFLPMIRSPKD